MSAAEAKTSPISGVFMKFGKLWELERLPKG